MQPTSPPDSSSTPQPAMNNVGATGPNNDVTTSAMPIATGDKRKSKRLRSPLRDQDHADNINTHGDGDGQPLSLIHI